MNAEFRCLVLGDIGFSESYRSSSSQILQETDRLLGSDERSLAFLEHMLALGDLIIGNLEVPLFDRPDSYLIGIKRYLHWSYPNATISTLRKLRLSALSLANNHSLDCGADGLRQTLEMARAADIEPFGAGHDLSVASAPFIRTFSLGGHKRTIVIFAGFEFRDKYERMFNWYAASGRLGVNIIDPENIGIQIALLRPHIPNPIFIAYPHWGTDYRTATPKQRDLANQLVAAGVDIVVGHGAHVAQEIDTISGKPVIFGLGNFIFNSPGRFRKLNALPYGLVASLIFRNEGIAIQQSIRLHPILVDNRLTKFQPRPVERHEFDALTLALFGQSTLAGQQVRAGMDEVGHYFEMKI